MNGRTFIDAIKNVLRNSSFACRVASLLDDAALSPGPRVHLSRAQLWSADTIVPMRISVLTGHVWLTQENQFSDVLLRGGEEHACTAEGKIVIQAMDTSVLEILPITESRLPAHAENS
jgi:hypothetical protein